MSENKIPKSDFNTYTKFICVDEDLVPMSWDGEQLCYCTCSRLLDKQFPLEVYTRKQAEDYVKKTIKFRKKNKYEIGDYKLMPVK